MSELAAVDYTFHLIDPKLKDEKWALDFIKSRYPQLTGFFSTPYWNSRQDFATIRAYGQGVQSATIYKKMFSPEGYAASKGAKTGVDWTGMQWNIVSPMPKYKNIVSANLEKGVSTEIQCTATDELAQNKREHDKLLLKFQQQLDADLAEMSAKMKLPKPMKSGMGDEVQKSGGAEMSGINDMDFDMNSDVELQMYMDLTYKQSIELASEMAINTLFKLNEFDEIKKELINDALDFAVMPMRIYMDNNTCLPKMEWLKLENIKVGVGRRRDFKDADCWAYPEMLTVNELIGKFGKLVTPQDVKDIFKYGVTTNGYFNGTNYDRSWNNGGQWNEKVTRIDLDRVRVQVAYFAFKSQNCETTEYAKGKYNSIKQKSREYGYKAEKKESTVKQEWAQVVYKGYYITGMDKIYDYGLLPNMVREKGREQQVMLDLQLYKLAEKSFTENCITHLDGIQLAYLKFQVELLMSKPAGYAIDIDRMAELSFGDGGKMDLLATTQMYTQTGTYLYKSVNEDGDMLAGAASGAKPIDFLPNGVSESVNGYMAAIQFHINQIEASIGYNPVTAGAAPEARASATGQKIAAAAADNATYYLFSGLKTMVENAGRYMLSLVQDMSEYGGDGFEALKTMIGTTNMNVIKSMGKLHLHEFGVFIEEKLSEQELKEFQHMMFNAYEKGELPLSDILMLWRFKDWKQAIAIAQLRINKNMMRQQQAAQADMQMRQQELQSEQQLTAQLKQMEFQTSAQNTQQKVQGMLEAEKIKVAGKMNTQQIADNSKSQHIQQQNQGALLKESLKQQVA